METENDRTPEFDRRNDRNRSDVGEHEYIDVIEALRLGLGFGF